MNKTIMVLMLGALAGMAEFSGNVILQILIGVLLIGIFMANTIIDGLCRWDL